MNKDIKTNLKSLKNLLVLWTVVLAYIVVTGKQDILLVAILLASAVLVYFSVMTISSAIDFLNTSISLRRFLQCS